MQNNLNCLARIKKEFETVHRLFEASPAMQKILSGGMTIDHYKSYLRQTYHYIKDNPQIQALATVYFHGSNFEFDKMFYKYTKRKFTDACAGRMNSKCMKINLFELNKVKYEIE